jgi:serine/threonine protein phosphatase PrpC
MADLRVSVLSRTGGRSRNEDACGFWSDGDRGCYVLADGAGGHGGGDVAARIAVETVLATFAAGPVVSPRSVSVLISDANDAVMARQRQDASVDDMRSTLIVLQVDAVSRSVIWGHLGDSRLYRFRDGRFVGRTRDHSLLEDMIESGLLATGSAGRAVDRNVLTGSLGSVDTFFPAVIDTLVELREGDAFLLCSDGFWDHVDTTAMERTLAESSMPDAWLVRMEEAILPRLRTGSDNYSAVAVWFGDDDPSTRLFDMRREPGASPGDR